MLWNSIPAQLAKENKNVRTSMSNYRKEEKLVNIPLYTIANIEKIIAEF